MAIHTPEDNQQHPQYQDGAHMKWRTRRAFGRSTAGEQTAKYAEAFKEILKAKLGDDDTYRISILDAGTHRSRFSAIIVHSTIAKNEGAASTIGRDKEPRAVVVAHRLIVEASADPLQPLITQINQQNVEIPLYTQDVDNAHFINKVDALLCNEYGADVRVEQSGSIVLPNELSVEDKESLHEILFFATAAIEHTLSGFIPENKFSIRALAQEKLTARLNFNPEPVLNAVGLPVRSDIQVVLNAQTVAATQDPNTINSHNLSRVDGFVDLVYTPPMNPINPATGMPNTIHYTGRYVMTSTQTLSDVIDLERFVAALYSTLILNSNWNWGSVFKPRGNDLHDIGAIGIDVPQLVGTDGVGKPLDTRSSNFDSNALYHLLRTAFHESLIYSIDVPELDEQSWLTNVLFGVANRSERAVQSLVEALNNFFGGHYTNGMSKDMQVTDYLMNDGRIHLGYYRDEAGQLVDIRNIDYLYVLNATRDVDVITAWSGTFDNLDEPEPIRLEKRLAIIKQLVPSAVIKGTAQRLTLNPRLVENIQRAAIASDLVIHPSNIALGASVGRQRGRFNAAEQTLGTNIGSNFTYPKQPAYSHRNNHYGPYNQWIQ